MKPIRLVDVYADPDSLITIVFLYDLLAERDPAVNISHRQMPTFEQHRDFVNSHPYQAWYVVHAADDPVGAVYLTKPGGPSRAGNEIGVFIAKKHQSHGYGKQAVYLLMSMHPAKRFLANIAPGNERSIAMFRKLGFELVQCTLAKVRCDNCDDTGFVCENHPDLPWNGVSDDPRACACGGAGMPCPVCCDPVPQDGTHSIGECFTPRNQK